MFIPADQNYSCGVDEDTVKKIGRTQVYTKTLFMTENISSTCYTLCTVYIS